MNYNDLLKQIYKKHNKHLFKENELSKLIYDYMSKYMEKEIKKSYISGQNNIITNLKLFLDTNKL